MLKGIDTNTNNYLIKQLPKATAFVNKKFEVVYASDIWVDENELRSKNIFGKSIYKLFPKLGDPCSIALKDCLLGKSTETKFDCNSDTGSGDKWFEWTCNPWFDEKENIIGLIIHTENISEHKLTQDKLTKLESLLRTTSEIGKIGSWEYDIAHDKLTWCDMTRKIHEVPKDFVPHLEGAINFYKDGYSKNTISMVVHEALTKGTQWNEKLQIVTAKGNEIWVHTAGKPILNNDKLVGLTGTFQNIDAEIEHEAKTKYNENLLRTLVDNLPLNVYVKDKESRKILVNKSECDFLGVTDPNEVLGKSNNDLYDADVAEMLNQEDLAVIETLKPIFGKEDVIRKKTGESTHFLISKIPLLNEKGKAYGLIGISHDISEIKRKEEELRNLINVTALQNKKLISFAHIVSHNLRSHTANFSMLLEFLVNEQNENEKQNILKMLMNSSDNLMETLENLNDVVTINTNMGITKKTVSFNAKMQDVEENLSAFLKNNNAKIINNVPDNLKINVVPTYLESILTNFITNAVKYKKPDIDPIVTLSATIEKGTTLISISDNGLGIDLNKYGDKIFGMYKTFHSNSDARGIGLYIAKNQIEAMNAKVSVSSEVGIGSTFKIYFDEEI